MCFRLDLAPGLGQVPFLLFLANLARNFLLESRCQHRGNWQCRVSLDLFFLICWMGWDIFVKNNPIKVSRKRDPKLYLASLSSIGQNAPAVAGYALSLYLVAALLVLCMNPIPLLKYLCLAYDFDLVNRIETFRNREGCSVVQENLNEVMPI